ncbi:hypothetical protein PY254_16070 [Rhodanobacter sp. AS-Z3]|uniref:hypothetical protein n=1 Tax=Rhodanobacter sp. AS-Z3 TaxID=3031330 RepID=UPI00247A615B|nr:hypothetical protein [Rhodanobacter sp. AS-Z3]WEN14729.1 hypothetical protein PY254_16070 [Rhodanobacter sp. AS-Z3]
MKSRSLLLIPSMFFALWLGGGPLHAQQAVSLKQQMGAAQFNQAGLDKLSPAELVSLQKWLATHAVEMAAAVPASEVSSANVVADKGASQSIAATQKKSDKARSKASRIVTSPIAGRFDGWGPGSVIVLQNGQKWRISDDSSLQVTRSLESPVATVKPGVLGSWMLKVEGYNTSARVRPAN